MGIMVSEVYEALIAAGAPEDKAKAAAEAIPVSGVSGDQGRHRRHQAGHRRLEGSDSAGHRQAGKTDGPSWKLAAYGVGATDLALLIDLAFFS